MTSNKVLKHDKSGFIFLTIILSMLLPAICHAQMPESLFDLFPFTTADKLHIYVDTSEQYKDQKNRLLSTVAVLAKFKPDDKPLVIMERFKEYDGPLIFEYELFALLRFNINNQFDGYLIEEIPDGNMKRSIYCFLYDKTIGYFTQVIEVAYIYGYEGSEGFKESYILDLTDNGTKDIVIMEFTRSSFTTLNDDFVINEYKNSLFLFLRFGQYQEYDGFIPENP